MRRSRSSMTIRWAAVAAALAIAGAASTIRPAPGVAPPALDLSRALGLIFPALSAQTIVSGCTNGDVNSGNQVTTTVERFAVEDSQGNETLITNTPRSVDLLGAPGTNVVDRFFENLPIPAGTYTQLNITVSGEMTYIGNVGCVIGGQTRYYYSHGSATPPSPFSLSSATAAASAVSTTVTVEGDTSFELSVTFTVNAGVTTVVNIDFDPTLAVYDVHNNGTTYAIFPAANATGAATQ